jgi:hypothetical protein
MSTCSVSSCFDKLAFSSCSSDGSGSSPGDDADDWEKRVDLVVLVEVEELDWWAEWDRRTEEWRERGGEEEGDVSSLIARPAAMNLLTPCTPSRIPSSMALLPWPGDDVPSMLDFSNPLLTICSHLRFTIEQNEMAE